jgi:hypothetical protein
MRVAWKNLAKPDSSDAASICIRIDSRTFVVRGTSRVIGQTPESPV